MERIGFIGLGIMGRGMTHNLLKAGMDEFAAAGAKTASSPADLAARCDVILVCVSDTPDVEQVLFGENGVSAGVKSGALVVDHSTISPQKTVEMVKRLNAQGVAYLDAPVSGGSEGAAKGILSIMVGGAAADVERAMPVLQAYGKTITHVGAQGAGQMAKLVNQILVVVNQLAASEALLFDLAKTIEAVKGGAAGSWMLANRGPQMIVRDFRPGFTIDLQQKDLRLVLEAADEMGVPLMATSLVFQLYRTLQAQGLGGDGNHGLVKALEQLMGMELGK
jgi:3-hydroxyisobutyrate dehydrogenase-like beta-hydroxyacid dehydrogenase